MAGPAPLRVSLQAPPGPPWSTARRLNAASVLPLDHAQGEFGSPCAHRPERPLPLEPRRGGNPARPARQSHDCPSGLLTTNLPLNVRIICT